MRIMDTDRQIDMYSISFATTHSNSLISMAPHSLVCSYFYFLLFLFIFYFNRIPILRLKWCSDIVEDFMKNEIIYWTFCWSIGKHKVELSQTSIKNCFSSFSIYSKNYFSNWFLGTIECVFWYIVNCINEICPKFMKLCVWLDFYE